MGLFVLVLASGIYQVCGRSMCMCSVYSIIAVGRDYCIFWFLAFYGLDECVSWNGDIDWWRIAFASPRVVDATWGARLRLAATSLRSQTKAHVTNNYIVLSIQRAHDIQIIMICGLMVEEFESIRRAR